MTSKEHDPRGKKLESDHGLQVETSRTDAPRPIINMNRDDEEDLTTYLQRRHCPQAWLDTVNGKLSIEQAAEQARQQGDSPRLIEQSKALFEPLSEVEREHMHRTLVKQFGRSPTNSRRLLLFATLAAAAAVVLLLMWPGRLQTETEKPDITLLTAHYTLSLTGHASQRSSTGGSAEHSESNDTMTTLYEGFSFKLVATPQQEVQQAVELKLFALRSGFSPRQIETLTTSHVGGRLDTLVTAEHLSLDPGAWELVVVVGAKGGINNDPEVYTSLKDTERGPQGEWIFRRRLTILARPGGNTSYLRVEYSGCESIMSWQCVVNPGDQLTLWIEDPEASDVEIFINEQKVSVEESYSLSSPTGIAEGPSLAPIGTGFRIIVPDLHGEAEAQQPGQTPPGDGTWKLTIQHPRYRQPWTVPLNFAAAIKLDDAMREAAETFVRLKSTAAEAMRQDRWEDSIEARLELMRLAQRHQYWTQAVIAGSAVGYLLAHRVEWSERTKSRLHEIEQMLQATENAGHVDPRARGHLRFYQGLLAQRQGRVHRATRFMLDAARLSLALRNHRLAAGAIPMFVQMLIDRGHYSQAQQWLEVAIGLSEHLEGCPQANLLRKAGWSSLLLMEAGQPEVDRALPLLERAREVYESTDDCSERHELISTLVDIAQASATRGLFDEAMTYLADLEGADLTPNLRFSAADARVQVAMGTDPSGARVAVKRLADAVKGYPTPEAQWRLAFRQGQAAKALGRVDDAVQAYEHAERVLDERVQLWALGAEYDLFIAQRLASAQGLVGVLLDNNRPADALCAARRARARSLWAAIPSSHKPEVEAELAELRAQYIQARAAEDDYTQAYQLLPTKRMREEAGRTTQRLETLHRRLKEHREQLGISGKAPTCDELRPPEPGELVLVLFPLGRDQWAIFAADDQGVNARRTVAPTAAEASEVLLAPFAEKVDRAQTIRVIASQAAYDVPVHMLPWNQQPLMATKRVVYGADLPVDRSAARPHGHRALLVEDPTGTLTIAAKKEIDMVSEELREHHWSVETLNPQQVEPTTLLEAFAQTDLFHFAGHGKVGGTVRLDWPTLEGGLPGWSSSIDLGEGRRLDVREVLNAAAVPSTVVLAGCQTGVVDGRSPTGGMSLAMAFLLAGSQVVVASTEELPNIGTLEAMEQVYRWGIVGADRATEQEADKQQSLQRDLGNTSEVWSKLRVWVR